MLQTRVAQRGGRAAVRIAVDLVDEGRISEQEAAERIKDDQLEAARAPRFADAAPEADVIARGLASSPGGAVGEVAFDAARAQAMADEGRKVVLIRPTTSPDRRAGLHRQRRGRHRQGRAHQPRRGRRARHGPPRRLRHRRGRGARRRSRRAHRRRRDAPRATEIAVDGDRGIVSRSAPPFADMAEDPYVTKLSAYGESA